MNIYKRASLGLFFLILITKAFCQDISGDSTAIDTLSVINTLASDSLTVTDSLSAKQDSLNLVPQGDIETTINYSAKDSMNLSLNNRIIDIYGDGKITYGDIELTADRIEVDYAVQEISAEGSEDTLGNKYGEPVFKDDLEVYETKKMRYNFKTKKAIIKGVVTQQGEAIMHGSNVMRNQHGDMYIDHAKYTTCNLPEPHFHIEAEKLKVIPNSKIIVGPFHMRVADIPVPIGWGFGMFPMPRKKSSGIIVPTFGEETRRGFYLRDGGYYLALSQYFDLTLTGEIYSKGSYGLNAATIYRKRYAFDGRFNFKYNRQKGIEEGDSSVLQDFWINWSHSPKTKGTGRFSASVNAGSSSYNQNNPSYYDMSRNLNQEFSSNVSYSNVIHGTPFNYSTKFRLQQNTSTGVVNMNLPDVSVNMNRIYPFKGKAPSAKTWWQKINMGWSAVATNKISNNKVRSPFGSSINIVNKDPYYDSIVSFEDGNINQILDRMQYGVKHSIPISTSLKIFKYYTFSPSFSYSELWYGKELHYEWDDDLNGVKIDTLEGFSRAYSFNSGGSMSSRLYGTVYFKSEKIQAIRHVITPSIGVSFAPDFSNEKYGYYQDVQIDSIGNTRRMSKYQGFVYGTPSQGENASLSFSLNNNLEMKVKNDKDTTEQSKKVSLLENLSFSTGYNFLADSFNLSTIKISGRTNLFNRKLGLNFGATVDPYIYLVDSIYFDGEGNQRANQTRVNQFAWNNGQGLGRISSFNFSVSTNLNPKARESKKDKIGDNLSEDEEAEMDFIEANPDLYVDFDIPWSLRLNYNFNYRRVGYNEPSITQSLRLTGDVSLTKKWKIGFSSGYDFEKKDFTQTNFNVSRDLHCWAFAFTWIPFGRYQSYNVTINAKSSLLQDLKLNRKRSWWDN
ncbi:putative LPS assembly protein LptD [Bacteroidota bacterium]